MTTTKKAGPKPRTRRKAVVKTCSSGHRQTSRWRVGDSCWQCSRDAEREYREAMASSETAAAERAAGMIGIPPLPDSFTIRSGDGKSVMSFSTRLKRRR
jgi:hypothetical protein